MTKIEIPKPVLMPDPEHTAQAIQARLEQRWSRLCGMQPWFALKLEQHGAWVVGSTVWNQALYGVPKIAADLDLVFQKPEDRDEVLTLARDYGKRTDQVWRDDADSYFTNAAVRVSHGDETLIDLWVPPLGVTVEEMILSFDDPYKRVGYDCATGRLFRGIHRCNPPGTNGPQPWERK